MATRTLRINTTGGTDRIESAVFYVQPAVLASRAIMTKFVSFKWVDTRHDEVIPLRGEDYPSLVATWDNEADAIYDTL